MKLPGFSSLGRISGQIAVLVVVSIVTLHAIVTASFLLQRQDPPETDRGPGPLATSVRLIGATPAGERQRLLADIARAFPSLGIEQLPGDFQPPADEARSPHLRGLRHAQSSCGKCGQKNSASNSMPCEANSSRRKSCGSRNACSGKASVPRPS